MNLFFFKMLLIFVSCLTRTSLCLSETVEDWKEVAAYSINLISYDFCPKVPWYKSFQTVSAAFLLKASEFRSQSLRMYSRGSFWKSSKSEAELSMLGKRRSQSMYWKFCSLRNPLSLSLPTNPITAAKIFEAVSSSPFGFARELKIKLVTSYPILPIKFSLQPLSFLLSSSLFMY